jgi:hypothetical protein
MADSGELTRAEHYDRIRNQIEHEDQQVNLRVIWQLIAQAFFFSAYTTLLAITGNPKTNCLMDSNPFYCGSFQSSVYSVDCSLQSASFPLSATLNICVVCMNGIRAIENLKTRPPSCFRLFKVLSAFVNWVKSHPSAYQYCSPSPGSSF